MLNMTTPWCSGVSSVTRPRCAFKTWLPYKYGISPLGLIQIWYHVSRYIQALTSRFPPLFISSSFLPGNCPVWHQRSRLSSSSMGWPATQVKCSALYDICRVWVPARLIAANVSLRVILAWTYGGRAAHSMDTTLSVASFRTYLCTPRRLLTCTYLHIAHVRKPNVGPVQTCIDISPSSKKFHACDLDS